ncbi:aromatic ring-hydroxylating dioxygenase subunit alpha [Rhodobacteraceae bacterium B1Z28]|uniref:Aromatic ring-hydroxylating dioxygenase subunit alpha n=1 Tax=Ruegeria haliotis TaxID=2747601 RepID=A0ABX2PT63_9RHOB|nr:aromatic ring-hydroxylating dioxygenase subunit alpha [Ruegeria haliotis]NVO56239.1 aromatic ring-hydroxylating dioxygenase subunit alpha [Ruegeria haliotis]
MTSQPANLNELVGQHTPGYALPREFYTSEAVFDRDIADVWNRNWIWVGHESQIPEPGDYFLFDYGPESLIIVRDRNGDVRAHLNVCRHRGSRVCVEGAGKARVFVCPYHAWTYELSGELRAGREMGPDFNPEDWGLKPAHVQIFQGLILVCPSAEAPPMDQALGQLAPLTAPFGFEDLKVVHTANYPVPANWKLAVENYLECYHCAPAHQEYSRSHTLKSPQQMEALLPAMYERAVAAGLPNQVLDLTGEHALSPGSEVYYRRYPLYEGFKTGSKMGEPLAPLLGNLTDYDGGATDIVLGILNYFLIYSDHVVGYRFVPRTIQETDIQVVWMVRKDAEEGRDYNSEDLTWLWHVTSQDDERIIRHNQAGVNSHFFEPGPLADMEWAINDFYRFYKTMISPR